MRVSWVADFEYILRILFESLSYWIQCGSLQLQKMNIILWFKYYLFYCIIKLYTGYMHY